MSRDYHVIALDLPGHGETPLMENQELNIMFFVHAVNDVSVVLHFFFFFVMISSININEITSVNEFSQSCYGMQATKISKFK